MERARTRFMHRLGLATAVSLLASAPLFAASYADDRYAPDAGADADGYDTAEVLRSEPQMRSYRVVEPRRDCYSETRYVPVGGRPAARDSGAATLVGGVLGAVLGHQIGQREARGVGTVAGALIGGAIGHQMGQEQARRTGYADAAQEYRAVAGERCEVRQVERMVDRVDSYRVTYRYNGHIFSTRLAYDPGTTLRVRVNVEPVG